MSTQFGLTLFDSPFVDGFASISALDDGVGTAVADPHWHMMIMRLNGKVRMTVTGPLTHLSTKAHRSGTEYIGIRFKVGAYMPHLPVANLVDRGMVLPQASSKSFWLYGSAWEFPTENNVDVFVERLARQEIVVREPLVTSALQGELPDVSSRSVQRRFLQATGLPQRSLYQIERAQQALALLQQGTSILDTVEQAGYFDQPHLTRALKRFVGQTPAQIARMSQPEF
ncbi:MAG: helix-turn-helix domain-containing protein [Chloroflexi bacterium]|nr:helix-turn-helix domain-containing protein [Chloroflexota bacterium]